MDDHFPTDRRIESTAASTPRFVLDAITRSDGEEESAESE